MCVMFTVSVAVLLLIMHCMYVCTSEWKCGGCVVCLMCTNVWWADQQQHTIYPAIHPYQLPPAATIPENLLWPSKGHIPIQPSTHTSYPHQQPYQRTFCGLPKDTFHWVLFWVRSWDNSKAGFLWYDIRTSSQKCAAKGLLTKCICHMG